MSIEQEILAIINQIPAVLEKAFTEAFVERHPGHGNQKVHGRRGGGQDDQGKIKSVSDLSGDEKEALRRYSGDYFAQVNNNLRAGGRTSEEGEQVKSQVIKVMDKTSTTKDMTTFRGAEFYDPDSLEDLRGGAFVVGNSFIDKGFASTSLDKEQAAGFSGLVAPVEFEITIPAGSKALDISSISARPYEKEILLANQTKFKVVGVEKTGEDITDLWRVKLEVSND